MAVTRTFSIASSVDVPFATAGGAGAIPDVVVRSDGSWFTAGVVPIGGSDVLHVSLTNGGAPVQFYTRSGLTDPSLADTSDNSVGRTSAAVAATNASGQVVLESLAFQGTGFGPINLGSGSNADVASTGAGIRIATVFQRDYGGGDHDIILDIRDAAGNLVDGLTIDNSKANDQDPTVAYIGGNFVVAWNRIDASGNTSLWYATYDTEGNPDRPPTLIDAAGSINRTPSIVERSAGGFVIAYEDNQSGDSEIKTYLLGTDGIPVYTPLTSLPGVDGRPSVTEMDNLFLTTFTHDTLDAGELRQRQILMSITDQQGVLLTDPANPIVIASSGEIDSNPSIADFGFYGRGRFIVSYDSTSDGRIHQQVMQIGETITGDGDANILQGRADGIVWINAGGGKDKLYGNDDADTLDGGADADRMEGSYGNDTYFVDNAADVIVEAANGGTADWVKASATFDLLTGVHVEKLSTTNAKSTAKINLYGNEIVQEITGNAGANILSDGGKGGSDTLVGLGGNDTYKVYNSGTKIVEGPDAGSDTVQAAVSYTLASGVYVQVLETTNAAGKTAISLFSNDFGQTVNGNAGNNVLRGYAGNDTINGREGNDKISGGLGSDTLAGNAGADTYYFSYALGASNVDTINGFSSIDLISLSSSIFTKAGPKGALAASAFWSNTTGLAHDASDRVIWETDTGRLYYDPDGTGAASRVLFAVVTGNTGPMNAGDFVVA